MTRRASPETTAREPRGLTLADFLAALGEEQVLIAVIQAYGTESHCAACGAACYLIAGERRSYLIDRRVSRMRTQANGPLAWMLPIHRCPPKGGDRCGAS